MREAFPSLKKPKTGGYIKKDPFYYELKPAHFERGKTTIVKSFKVNESGGILEIGNLGTPVDGTVIEIPKGALDREITLSVGYNDGTLNLIAGKASNVVGVLSFDIPSSPQKPIELPFFQEPITIKIRFDPSIFRTNPGTVVVYAIDEQGHLHGLNIKSINKEIGIVSFFTWPPLPTLMFTWVYAFYDK